MPTYDYRCRKCKHEFELFHSISDDAPKRCPRCRAKAVRVPSAGAGLLFKGSGFYVTDYRSKAYRDKAKKEGGSGEGKSGEGKSGERKSGERKSGTRGDSGGRSGGAGARSGPSEKSGKGD